MRRATAVRTLLGWMLVCSTVTLSVGIFPERAADHDGGEAHVEVAHGGHGLALLTGEARVPVVYAAIPTAGLGVTRAWAAPPERPIVVPVVSTVSPNGPDPPHQLGARAPPHHYV